MVPVRIRAAALAIALPLVVAHCSNVAPAPDDSVVAALAPTGSLRIAVYPGSPTSLVRDAASGAPRGVAVELGQSMARRLGVAPKLVEYASNADALAAVKAGRADFAFTNATPARAQEMDFSSAVLAVEQGYLVPGASSLESAATVDRPGVRVGVTRGSTSERELPAQLKSATVVTVPTVKEGAHMLAEGSLDAFATNKAILYQMSDAIAGSRVLPGAYGREALAIGIPKGRERALRWLERFVQEVKANGEVARAMQGTGLRGTTLAD